MKHKEIIIIGAAVGAYLLFAGKGTGDGGTGGGGGEITPGYPDMLSGSVVPAPETGFVPSSYLHGLMAKKGSTSYLSGVPVSSATGAFQSSYPIVMYDSSKGGNQLAVQSAQSKPLPSLFSKMTGGLGTSSDLTLKKSSSSSGPASSSSYSSDSGGSSTLHSRMGVR